MPFYHSTITLLHCRGTFGLEDTHSLYDKLTRLTAFFCQVTEGKMEIKSGLLLKSHVGAAQITSKKHADEV